MEKEISCLFSQTDIFKWCQFHFVGSMQQWTYAILWGYLLWQKAQALQWNILLNSYSFESLETSKGAIFSLWNFKDCFTATSFKKDLNKKNLKKWLIHKINVGRFGESECLSASLALRFFSLTCVQLFKSSEAVYPQGLQKMNAQSMLVFVLWTDFSHSQKVTCLSYLSEGK